MVRVIPTAQSSGVLGVLRPLWYSGTQGRTFVLLGQYPPDTKIDVEGNCQGHRLVPLVWGEGPPHPSPH